MDVLRNLFGKDKKDESTQLKKSDSPRKEIVTLAHKIFTKALTDVPGWQVVPYERVANNKKYHAMFKPQTDNKTLASIMSIATRVGTAKYVTPPKLHYAPVDERPERAQIDAYAKLARTLGVDAVVAIHLKLGYDDGWISLAAMTKASPVAAAQLLMITKNGEIAVATPAIKKDSFMEADGSVWVTNRKLKLDRDAIKLYQQAIEMVAHKFKGRFITELSES